MRQTELSNPELDLFYFRRRLVIASALVLFAFGLLLVRFIYLQIFQHQHYRTLAEENRISILPVVPNRGVIVDRNGVVLAHNYSAYTLEIVPSKVKNMDAVIDELSQYVEVSPRDRKRFKKLLEEAKNFESLPLRTRLSDQEVARFAAQQFRFPGVEIRARLFRQYPYGKVASHVLGYIGRINDNDLERIALWDEAANYKGSDYIGKVGVEFSYQRELHGSTGYEEVEVDAAGRAMRTLSHYPSTAGNNLRLTLDIKLQQAAETAFGEQRGALVAIEPQSGEILAVVSKPGYDPNLFVEGIDPHNWDLLNNSPDKPLLNRPLRGAYPPGSTFKPFMALAALHLGKRTPEQSISDPGYFNFGGHTFRDDKVGGHGLVDMHKSIVVSCDTYYYLLASDLDIDELHSFLQQFGFGQKTGIDIEGELAGVLPSRAWKRQRFSGPQYREEHRRWYAGDNISIGIGQGYNAYTPLQLAYATALIANDGLAFKPRVVKSIENVKTGQLRELVGEPVKPLPLKPEHLATVKEAMVGVNLEGTSARAFAGAAYSSGGKTGTAQVLAMKPGEKYIASKIEERFRDHAWFIAYAPAEQPRIALAVLVENAGFGARAAAPIARQVFDYYLLGKPVSPPKDQANDQ